MPKRAAWSRSMFNANMPLFDCWSEATSRNCGSFCSAASSFGAQSSSSPMSESCRVY